MSHGGNEYMVAAGAAGRVVREGFEDCGVYCCFIEYRKYFVVHCGLIQVIEIGSDVRLSGVESMRGDPVTLYNISEDRSNMLGSIRGPIEVSMASRIVIDADDRHPCYPNRDNEALWQMIVILRYTFPDYTAGGQERQTGWVMIPYALADALATWVAMRAPAVQVEWRLDDASHTRPSTTRI
jgi:hypothetical protein